MITINANAFNFLEGGFKVITIDPWGSARVGNIQDLGHDSAQGTQEVQRKFARGGIQVTTYLLRLYPNCVKLPQVRRTGGDNPIACGKAPHQRGSAHIHMWPLICMEREGIPVLCGITSIPQQICADSPRCKCTLKVHAYSWLP